MKKYFTKQAFKDLFTILKAAYGGFSNDMALKFSASLAYYTVFSLAPLLLLVISLAGIFWAEKLSRGSCLQK
jgi:membrane protein